MKKLIFSILCLFFNLNACSEKEETQLSLTDERLLKLYKKETGIDLKPQEACIKRVTDLKDVISIGTFANDLGCIDGKVVVGNEIGSLQKMTHKGLQLNGWNDKNIDKAKLLLLWTRHVVLAWESPQFSTNEYFKRSDTPDFSPPSVKFQNGKWVVSLWVQNPVDMFPTKTYSPRVVLYDGLGNLINEEK